MFKIIITKIHYNSATIAQREKVKIRDMWKFAAVSSNSHLKSFADENRFSSSSGLLRLDFYGVMMRFIKVALGPRQITSINDSIFHPELVSI